jgi:hypothetical protein
MANHRAQAKAFLRAYGRAVVSCIQTKKISKKLSRTIRESKIPGCSMAASNTPTISWKTFMVEFDSAEISPFEEAGKKLRKFLLLHGYEGIAGLVSVFSLGVVLALIYLWRKSLVAPIVIHFLTDFATIILPTLLSARL